MDELISIIVPVYKVEAYLDKCIKSIIEQTYTNIEIILVDDCSPDSCGEKCDEYAKRDKRIKAIHHSSNRGLSAARNTGLDAAKGTYIGFVDSDDWIEPDMYKKLYLAAKENNADICQCRAYSECDNGTKVILQEAYITELNKHFAIENSCNYVLEMNSYYSDYFWSKLYKKSLFLKNRFKEGQLYEDVDLQWQLTLQSERITVIPDVLYHYNCCRTESIGHEESLKNCTDFWKSHKERYEALRKLMPELSDKLTACCFPPIRRAWGCALLQMAYY